MYTKKHLYDKPVHIDVREKPFSNTHNGFSIHRQPDGFEIFKTEGNAFQLNENVTLRDAEDHALYKFFKHDDKMYIVDMETNEKVYTMKKHGEVPHFGTGTVQAWKDGNVTDNPCLEIKGKLFRRDFFISELGTRDVVAHVHKKHLLEPNDLIGKDHFVITVQTGRDVALATTMVMAVDQLIRD